MAGRPLQNTNESQQIPLYYSPNTGGIGGHPSYVGLNGRGSSCLNLIPYATKTITGEIDIIFEKRQGFSNTGYTIPTKSGLTGTCSVRDMISINQASDVMVAAFFRDESGTNRIDIAQIRPTAGTWVLIGTISTTAGPPAVNISASTVVYLSEIKVGNVPGVSIVLSDRNAGANTSAAYYALTSGGVFPATSLTKISDADFPTNQTPYVHIVGKIIQMNQIAYIMASDGRIYNSNTDTLGTWSALGFLEAESYTDRGVGLERYKNHVVGFGENTVEFFNDVGTDPTTGSPLERMEQAFIKFGALYAKSIINIEDVLYWIGQSTSGTNNLWRLEGYTPVEIGNNRISIDIDNTKNTSGNDILGPQLQQVVLNGQKLLFLTVKVYDSSLANTIPYLTNEVGETAVRFSNARVHAWLFNIKDGLWSTFSYSNNTALYLDHVHFYFAFQPYINTTYLLFGEIEESVPDNLGDSLLSVNMASAITAEGYNDWSKDDNSELPVACAWASPILDFGTHKRKFLHRYIMQPIVQSGSFTASNTEYYKLAVLKEFVTGSSGLYYTRNIKVPDDYTTIPRIYGNRFGAFRNAQLFFFYQGAGPLSIRNAELDISQGLG